jgi:hypothetical protein
MEKDYLLLKRASASRPSGQWSDDDYDVLADGVMIGRIFKATGNHGCGRSPSGITRTGRPRMVMRRRARPPPKGAISTTLDIGRPQHLQVFCDASAARWLSRSESRSWIEIPGALGFLAHALAALKTRLEFMMEKRAA